MPSIYVASLSDYNNGRLDGAWIDLDGKDLEEVQEAVAAMLRGSKYPNVTVICPRCEGQTVDVFCQCSLCGGKGVVPSAEEYAIHDSEGFPKGYKVRECHDLAELLEVAELLAEHDEDLLAAAIEATGSTKPDDIRDAIEDRYRGAYDSEEDYAAELVAETVNPKDLPDIIRNYIDYESIARDLRLGGDCTFIRRGGMVYVFDG